MLPGSEVKRIQKHTGSLPPKQYKQKFDFKRLFIRKFVVESQEKRVLLIHIKFKYIAQQNISQIESYIREKRVSYKYSKSILLMISVMFSN